MPLFLLPAAAGLLLAAAFPRANQAWLGWAAWIPLILFIACAKSRRAAFLGGWLTGVIGFFILLRWMPEVMVSYGGMPPLLSWAAYALLVAVLACYPAAACAFTRWLISRRGERCLLFFPFAWIFMELAMSVSPFGGFPWLLAGYTQTSFLQVIQISDITGIYGVSFLLLCVNTAIAWFIKNYFFDIPANGNIFRAWARIFAVRQGRIGRGVLAAVRKVKPDAALRQKDRAGAENVSVRGYGKRGREIFMPLLAAAVLTGGVLIYGYAAVNRWEKSEAPYRAALLQGNLSVDDPHEVLYEKFEQGYIRMADGLVSDSVDVLILPESSAPKLFQTDDDYRRTMEDLARRYTFGLVLSNINLETLQDGTWKYYNSAFFLSGDGSLSGVYDKIHLVPFGEYIPMKKLLFFAETVSKEMGGFSAGAELRILPLGGRPANAVICFEAVFPDLVRRFVARGSQVIVNLTNDGWYGVSAAPYHHLEVARVRAVENRRYFLRSANTGFSAVIEPTGRIAVSTGLAEEATCLGRFGFIEEKTFYSRYGNVFAWLCVIISAAAGIWAARDWSFRKGNLTKNWQAPKTSESRLATETKAEFTQQGK